MQVYIQICIYMENESKFEVGDIVKLKTDSGFDMVISEIINNNVIRAAWFNKETSKYESQDFYSWVLKKSKN